MSWNVLCDLGNKTNKATVLLKFKKEKLSVAWIAYVISFSVVETSGKSLNSKAFVIFVKSQRSEKCNRSAKRLKFSGVSALSRFKGFF